MFKLLESFKFCTELYFYKFPSKVTITKDLIGRQNQYRTPLKEVGIQNSLDQIFPEFKNKIISEEFPTHQSVKDLDEVEVSVYCRKKKIDFEQINDLNLFKTVNHVKDLFHTDNPYYYISDVDKCIETLPKDTSSCFPLYIKKGLEKNIIDVKFNVNKFNSILNIINLVKFLRNYPTTVFHRFTPKLKVYKEHFFKSSYKIRQIFGVSHFICVLEVMYLSYFKTSFDLNMSQIYTIGLTRPQISNLISNVRLKASNDNKLILCGDINGCDKSVPFHFHNLLCSIFISYAPNNFIKSKIISLMNFLCYTPILTQDKIVLSHGSNTSGSWITSLMNTFSLYFTLTYCYLFLYNKLPSKGDLLVQGDDFIVCIEEGDEVYFKELFLMFNLRLKLDGTKVIKYYEDVEYLGFKWNYRNEPYQENSWYYSRTIYPEKVINFPGPDRSISRFLSLIFQTIDGNYLFKKFLDIDKYMKDKMLLSKKPTFTLIGNTGDIYTMKIPIDIFLIYGWKMF